MPGNRVDRVSTLSTSIGYRALLSNPRVRGLLVVQLLACFPSGMISISLLLLIAGRTGSFVDAGVVLAALSIGRVLGGPLGGRLLGVVGPPVLLPVTAVISATAAVVLAVWDAPLEISAALSGLYGLALPPVKQLARALYPSLVRDEERGAIYALDAVLQEIIYIGGPLAAALLATLDPAVATTAAGACLMLGTIGFARLAVTREQKRAGAPARFGAVLLQGPVLLGGALGLFLMAACSAYEASAVANFGQSVSLAAGGLIAIYAAGSMLGSLVVGRLDAGPKLLPASAALFSAGFVVAASTDRYAVVATGLVIAGLGYGPSLATLYNNVSAAVPAALRAEAYGWISSAQLIGLAVGAAIAGVMIDVTGSGAGMLVAAAAGALALVAAVVVSNTARRPDCDPTDP